MKKLLSLCMMLVFLFMPLGSSVTLAEEEKKQEQTGQRISENLFKGYTDDVYKGKYYEVDTEAPKKDEKGVIEKVGSYFFGEDSIGQDIQRMIYTTCQWFVNLAFKLNIMLTQLTMFLVDQALNLDIVSGVADKLAASMQNISGIGEDEEGNVNFLSGGLFPSIISLMCVLSGCYAAYVFFIKRQPTAGLNELVKTVLVIAFILVFIGNAGTVLKTANTISSEVSTTILAKATGTVAGEPGRSQKQAISSVKKQIWSILVERPYLFMQYGEDSKEKIGAGRVDELLKTAPGKNRNNIVKEEVEKKGNQMMKLDSVGDRIIFTLIYYIVNTFIGIPILAFCLLIVAFQLWFLVMSLIAPIVLAVALLPGHRKVIESWVTQWIRPLALKVLMSIMLVIIFTVSELLYVLPEAGLAGYVSTMVFQIIVFILCYIFRDSITASFKKTKNIYRTVTDISLMTENFANRGKEMAMDVGGAVSERVGDHFNSAAELVAAGEPEPIEKGETKEEEDKKPKLAKVDVPADLSAYEKNEESEEDEENSKSKQLISLQDHRQEEQEDPEQNEQDMPEQQLVRLDPEELEKVLETAEEAGVIDTENQDQDREYASLGEFTDTTPLEENLEELPHLDIPQEHISDDIVPNDPVALDKNVIPEIMPEQIGTEGVIYPQDTDIDVESTIQGNITETSIISAPRETATIPDLIPAAVNPDGEISSKQEIGIPVTPSEIATTNVGSMVSQGVIETPIVSTPAETVTIPGLIPATITPDGEIRPQQEIGVPVLPSEIATSTITANTHVDAVLPQDVMETPSVSTPNETVTIPDAIAAGSEDWNLPTQEPKQLNHLDSMEDK
ncbi:CD3337/EF1877 family mobilome membrane protein [Bacillus sp. SRB3LM]|uniref:CD3337/EF1877 family mobilome membrane protein n=1 Tax=Bacillus sp. SRB3LM TaxID=2608689 RepID=UPI0018C35E16|nr:CPBP family intramembrane metalloprotease [Bacillus sp. SRB3LM]MBG0967725.1 type IV secretion system protein [Bacillus sp. SRB3LM]MBG0969225.1 type IV secretion system protein [Bacillus sp. SRB3LM]MBG0971699.1 type IV secretion system protein [Bacillus sp. SRB3LM]